MPTAVAASQRARRSRARCCRSGWRGCSALAALASIGALRVAAAGRRAAAGAGAAVGRAVAVAAAVARAASPRGCRAAGARARSRSARRRGGGAVRRLLALRRRARAAASRATGTSWPPGSAAGCRRSGPCGCRTSSADPWPRIVLELLGARAADPRRAADVLAARRAGAGGRGCRCAVPERGYPFIALAVLIVVVASPVVSLGGTRLAAARAGARRAVGLLPVARAAAAAARARRRRRCSRSRWPARCRWRRRPTAASRGSTTARSPRASGPTTRCASRGRRATARSTGRATATRSCGSSPASRCTGRRATSTRSTATPGRSAGAAEDARVGDEPLRGRPPGGLGGTARRGRDDRRSASAACGPRT